MAGSATSLHCLLRMSRTARTASNRKQTPIAKALENPSNRQTTPPNRQTAPRNRHGLPLPLLRPVLLTQLRTQERGAQARRALEEHPAMKHVREALASIPTGDLPTPRLRSPEDSALVPTPFKPRPTSSETTGSRNLVPADASSTGAQHGETGVAVMSKLQHLELMDPRETDRLVEASLPPAVVSGLSERVREWGDPVYGFDYEFVGFEFGGAPEEDIAAAMDILDRANARCPIEIAEKAVQTLRIRTVRRFEDVDDMVAVIAVYSEDLSEYPADVVIDACRSWARQSKWFPAWVELQELCDLMIRRRRAMRDAVSGNGLRK